MHSFGGRVGAALRAVALSLVVLLGHTIPGHAQEFTETFPTITTLNTTISFTKNGVTFRFRQNGVTGQSINYNIPFSGSSAGYEPSTYALRMNATDVDYTTYNVAVLDRADGQPWVFNGMYINSSLDNSFPTPIDVTGYDAQRNIVFSATLPAMSSALLGFGSRTTVTSIELKALDFRQVFVDQISGNTVLDTTAPTVLSVDSLAANGSYKVGDVVNVRVNFSEPVTVTGTPQLTLETGTIDRTINYTSGSGSAELMFSYTVQSGDVSADLDYAGTSALSLNSGTIRDGGANDAVLTLASPGAANSLAAAKAIVIDGVAPTVSSVTSSTADGTYKLGDIVSVQVNFSEAVTVTGTPQLALETGATDQVVSYVSGSGTSALTFNYTVQSGDASVDLDYVSTSSLALNGGTVRDAAGNNATLTLASPGSANSLGTNKALVIDGVVPTAAIVVADTSLTVGETSLVTITFNEAVTGFSNAILTVSNGTLSAVSSGDGGITWTTTFTPANSLTNPTNLITIDMSAISDAAGNSGAGTTNSNNYAIDTIRPTSTIVVADTSMIAGETSLVTITFSEAVTGFNNAALTVPNGILSAVSSGDGGVNWTATFTPTSFVTDPTNLITIDMATVTDTAGNVGSGTTDSNNYEVNTAIVSLTPAAGALTTATFGSAYSVTLTASGGAAAYSYAITAGALPAGLSLGTATGAITGTPTAVGVANFTVTATDSNSIAGSAAYSISVQAAVPGSPTTVTATPGDAQATVSFTGPVNVGGSAVTGYTVTISPSDVAPVSGASSPITVTGLTNGQAYTFTVTATNSAGTGPASASSNSATPAAAQTITFNNPGAQSFGTSPTLIATSTSGLTPTFTSSTSGVCTITQGGALTLVTAGTCTISAAQAGNSSYFAATTVTRSFTINPVVPDAPTIGTATAGNTQATVTFMAPANSGGSPVTGYTVTASPADVPPVSGSSSPITITGLNNGQVYTFTVTATNGAGTGPASASSNSTTPTANTAPVANAGPDQNVASAASVTLSGLASTDADNNTLTYAWTQTSGTNVTLSSATAAQLTFTAPTLAVGAPNATLVFSLTVNDGTTNSTADTVTITVQAPTQTPATAFAAANDVIRITLTEDAARTLRSNLAVSHRMSRDARIRYLQAQDPELVGDASVPIDVDGDLEVNGITISSKGTFYGLAGTGNGTHRIVFGDFDIQHDSKTGSSTATLNGRVAWERMLSDKTMLGYFIGGELARSNIAGYFDGTQNRFGFTIGSYAVHELADQVVLDGFFSLGAGRNSLELTDTVLALESDYITRSVLVGAVLSGVIEQDSFEIWPELSLNYGRTWIGDAGFTGSAYGLLDDTMILDVGHVTLASMILRPEIRVSLDGLSGANSLRLVTFAPRLMCEQIRATITEDNCGGGAELGFSGRSADGLSSVSAKVWADRISGATKSSIQLYLEHQF
jgi:hypothetical protein